MNLLLHSRIYSESQEDTRNTSPDSDDIYCKSQFKVFEGTLAAGVHYVDSLCDDGFALSEITRPK